MRMKGISLPVNAVVVIALAIFVLLMMAAFFGGGFGQTTQVNAASAWSRACSTLKTSYECKEMDFSTEFDIDGDGYGDSFVKICRAYFDNPDLSLRECRDKCCGTTTKYLSREGESCVSNTDCQEGLSCIYGKCCDTSSKATQIGEDCSSKECCPALVCVDAKANPSASPTGKRCCPSGSTFFNTTSGNCE